MSYYGKIDLFEIRPYWNRDMYQAARATAAVLSVFEIRPYWNRDTKIPTQTSEDIEFEIRPYWNRD